MPPRLPGGSLELHLDAFAARLTALGYAKASITSKVGLAADFGRWLDRRRLPLAGISEVPVEEYIRHRRRSGRRYHPRWVAFRLLLDHLRAARAVPDKVAPVCDSSLDRADADFALYLARERGLVAGTSRNYRYLVRVFLRQRFRDGVIAVEKLRPSDVLTFVLRFAPTVRPKYAKHMTTALRAYLRFLRASGATTLDLAGAVPAVAGWRLATLPKFIKPEEVDRVLASCERSTVVGRRDHAILLLLARLGLRAGEVSGMMLDDIDWEAGTLTVRGKGGRHERLPLPRDVGATLAAYIAIRPRCSCRRVFILARAPHGGFSTPAVVSVRVSHALARAGLYPPSRGAHVFRHTLATQMLRRGATLAAIGEVLRHRDPDVTRLYAKVDIDGLRHVAHPWPVPR